jgi:hypothetical protein
MRPGVLPLTASAGVALVIAAGFVRRTEPVRDGASGRRTRAPEAVPEPVPADRPAREPGVAPDEVSFRRDLELLLQTKSGPGEAGRRRAVIERTLLQLEWPESRRRAFTSACETAVHEVESAWSVRDAGFAPGDEAVHARYGECKRMALERIDVLLDPSREPERRLKEGLEEWFDAIR